MRKVGAAILALPVLAVVYLATLRATRGARFGVGLAAALLVGLVAVTAIRPAPSQAVPAAAAPAPVAAHLVAAVATGHALAEPLRVAFDAPMDPSSVAAALRISPDAAVDFAWDDAGRVLTVTPNRAWNPDTLYVLTVAATARGRDGGRLSTPVRAVVLTARAGSGSIEATRATGRRARIDSAFRIRLDRDVPLTAVQAGLRVEPAITGRVTAGSVPGEFLWTPTEPLAVNATYRLAVEGLVDGDGVAFASAPSLEVSTALAPEVVRFRPVAGEKQVPRTAAVSVRFTERMDREATAAAFQVVADGKAVKGEVSWAEQGTVLVFIPADPLAYGAKIQAQVAAGAASRAGTPIAAATTGLFTVEPRPKPAPKARPAASGGSSGGSKPVNHSGGGGAVSGNWAGVESYYLRLMNCTRTGGWVTSGGRCSSPGGRNVAPLSLNRGISARVARPYAKLLATRNICSHFVGGNPGNRLSRAGYDSYRWAENLGCRSGNPYSAVLGSHRYFQSEKPYNGGHYVNMMNAAYRQVGIGVWVAGGRVRLVVDFYTP